MQLTLTELKIALIAVKITARKLYPYSAVEQYSFVSDIHRFDFRLSACSKNNDAPFGPTAEFVPRSFVQMIGECRACHSHALCNALLLHNRYSSIIFNTQYRIVSGRRYYFIKLIAYSKGTNRLMVALKRTSNYHEIKIIIAILIHFYPSCLTPKLSEVYVCCFRICRKLQRFSSTFKKKTHIFDQLIAI